MRPVREHRLARAPGGEFVVVGPRSRPVGGLVEGDVEGVPRSGVALGEHRADELEHHQVERGLEVVREVRLHQRGADRAQVVGKPDADAGVLARLGLAVLRRLHRRGHGRSGDAASIGVAVVRGLGGRAGVRGLRRLRHVFGLHQPLDDLERAVAPDGGDAAGDREILRLEPGAGFDLRFDLVETGLDGFGLLDQRVGPLVLVHVDELVVAGAELLDLGLLGVGRLGGLGLDAPEARGGAPVDVRHRLGPLPAGRELVGGRGELLHGELDEQRRVLEPDPVLVFVGEEVAEHRPTRGLVGVDADEARHGRAGRHPLLGQQALHLPGARAVALSRHLLPHRPLAVVIGGAAGDERGALGQRVLADLAFERELIERRLHHRHTGRKLFEVDEPEAGIVGRRQEHRRRPAGAVGGVAPGDAAQIDGVEQERPDVDDPVGPQAPPTRGPPPAAPRARRPARGSLPWTTRTSYHRARGTFLRRRAGTYSRRR